MIQKICTTYSIRHLHHSLPLQRTVLKTSFTSRHYIHRSTKETKTSFQKEVSQMKNARVVQVPVNDDNYAYLLIDCKTNNAAAIDPAEPARVIEAASREQVSITHCLTTHHHWDHAGGNMEMAQTHPGLVVVGGDKRIPALTKLVTHGQIFSLGSLTIESLFSPCHTLGHFLYLIKESPLEDDHASGEQPQQGCILFTGDTLFAGGCGRFFEGTGAQMNYALNTLIASLPPTTLLYCGHEYTVGNLKFAQRMEPNNSHISDKLAWSEAQRQQGLSTMPSTIASELLTNPFMRLGEPSIRQTLGMSKDASNDEVITKLREAKNKC